MLPAKALESLDDVALAAKSIEFREQLNAGRKTLEAIKVNAFAVCQEACDRRYWYF
jgi:preprotein translocase subunit SecA